MNVKDFRFAYVTIVIYNVCMIMIIASIAARFENYWLLLFTLFLKSGFPTTTIQTIHTEDDQNHLENDDMIEEESSDSDE